MRRETITVTLTIDIPDGEPLPSQTGHFSAFVAASLMFWSKMKVIEHKVETESVTKLQEEVKQLERIVDEGDKAIAACQRLTDARTVTLSKLAKALGVKKKDITGPLELAGFRMSQYNDLPMNEQNIAWLIKNFKKD